MHCSGMLWHPDVATQLVLASEDDRLPVIQMWDLRFATSPLKVLENHTRWPRICQCYLANRFRWLLLFHITFYDCLFSCILRVLKEHSILLYIHLNDAPVFYEVYGTFFIF